MSASIGRRWRHALICVTPAAICLCSGERDWVAMNPTAEPAPDFLDVAPQAVDRALNASLARFTQGIAPSSLIGAYMDRAVHLARRVMCRSATLDGPQCIAGPVGYRGTRGRGGAAGEVASCASSMPAGLPAWQAWPGANA